MAEQDTAAPVAAPVVFDPPHIYLHKDSRVPPLPVYSQAQADALPPEWMSPDVWNAGGGGGGGGGSQTPWTGDVDAAGHNLTSAGMVNASQVYAGGQLALQSSSDVLIGGPGPITLAGSEVAVNTDCSIAGWLTLPLIPQYANLAAAQAAMGAGNGIVWRDPNNALFVT